MGGSATISMFMGSLFSERSIRSDVILMQGGSRVRKMRTRRRRGENDIKNDVVKIGSHNIMDGLKLRDLFKYYQGDCFDVLCIQEDVHDPKDEDDRTYAERIADAMTGRETFSAHYDRSAPRLAMIYNKSKYKLQSSSVISLPRLASRSLPDRFMFGGGETEKKFALVSVLTSETSTRDLLIVNFHLDALGDNLHRYNQICDLLRHVKKQCNENEYDVVICGDTNMFDINRRKQVNALAMMLETFERFGVYPAKDSDAEPTHFFARADEPKFAHQIAVAFGQLGLDFPECFDIIASSSQTLSCGQVCTIESDHDLVWATISID